MRGRLCVSAPGKMMVSGEYAVLRGAPALVAAVSARGKLTLRAPQGDAPPDRAVLERRPEAAATLAIADEAFGQSTGGFGVELDTSELASGDRKFGLGSSAAVSAAAAGAVAALAGQDPSDPDVAARIYDAAVRGHRRVAPEGSGSDIVAACFGGLRMITPGATEGIPDSAPVAWPEGLLSSVVWTGQPARTSDLVRQVNALGERDPAALDSAMDHLGACARSFVDAFGAGDAGAIIEEVRRYHDAMASLGNAAGAPIVESRLAKVAALATASGGAAKPSGAGGGDVALGFFADSGAKDAFEAAARDAGFEVLELALGRGAGTEGPRVVSSAD